MRKTGLMSLLLLVISLVAGYPAGAVEPDEVLSDPRLEQRARNLSLELRCLVCQNQSIDDSDAPLAKDLRVLVRERLKAGDTDSQVIDYIVARYGEFVLLRPRFATHTLVLWLGTPLLLLIAVLLLYRSYRRSGGNGDNRKVKKLTAAEKRELNKLLKESREN
jgi:cytochrome c-type biogenesis protein CcmH